MSRPSHDSERHGKLSTGRGGAGNMAGKDQSPRLSAEGGTPTLKSGHYTTGRGGTGNMAKNDDPKLARERQDVDVPAITMPEGHFHTGRGGGGNMYKPSKDEVDHAKQHNEYVRRQSQSSQDGSHQRPKGLADKGKDLLFGRK